MSRPAQLQREVAHPCLFSPSSSKEWGQQTTPWSRLGTEALRSLAWSHWPWDVRRDRTWLLQGNRYEAEQETRHALGLDCFSECVHGTLLLGMGNI